jgi:poly(A) polymerase
VVFDTTILGSNPSAPAKKMNILSLNNNFLSKIKKKLFPFYKSKEIDKIFKILEKDQPKNKRVAMFVGGCVRKYLENQNIDDIDIATIFSPEELKVKFKDTAVRVIETGIDHGSIILMINNIKFEITTLRKDIKTDGRHAKVSYTDNWQEDSNRRDFTINSIYMDRKGKIFDPQMGVKDLNNKIIKFIGNPTQRIEEDFLRIIRFIRFSLQYNSQPSKLNLEAIKLNINGIKKLSKERILNELYKILHLNNLINLKKNVELKEIFLLIFPELKYLNRIERQEFLIDLKLSNDFTLALLLIDESDNYEYFCHKYKTSNILKEKLKLLSSLFQQYKLDKNFFTKNLKKNIYLFGKENIQDLNILIFFTSQKNIYKKYLDVSNKIKNVPIQRFPFDGKYLMQKGLIEGKKIGSALSVLEKKWIDNDLYLSDIEAENIISKIK